MPDSSIGVNASVVDSSSGRNASPTLSQTWATGRNNLMGRAKIDWFAATVWCSQSEMFSYLSRLGVADTFQAAGHGTRGYKTVYEGAEGARLHFDANGVKEDRCGIVLSGRAFDYFGLEKVLHLVGFFIMDGVRYRVTRIDFARDQQMFTASDMNEARIAGKIERNSRAYDWRDSDTGQSLMLGDRTSDLFLRVYDKPTEGDDLFTEGDKYTRVELEVKGDRAQEYWLYISQLSHDDFAGIDYAISSMINGLLSVDADWWRAWLDSAGKFWVLVRRVPKKIDEMTEWFIKSVAAAFSTIVDASASTGRARWTMVNDLLNIGRKKRSAYQEALVHHHQTEGVKYYVPIASVLRV